MMSDERQIEPEWHKHDGGPNPAPDQLVDLVWGIGIVERQPSDKVNWFFHWSWKPSALTPKEF